MNQTPQGERVHIAFFGKTNVGKSSLINKIVNQEISIVSEISGTTTDPVKKAMEIHGIGAALIIDTAGFDDDSELGEKRMEKTSHILNKTDIAVIVTTPDDIISDFSKELTWIEKIKEKNIPYLMVINKIDLSKDMDILKKRAIELTSKEAILVSVKENIGIEDLITSLEIICKFKDEDSICSHLVKKDDVVLLVMPQDTQAPKGRLILPQVQTIRDLLDNECTVICTTDERFEKSLSILKNSPNLIITDSQVFAKIYPLKPKESKLTSFSVLFSRYKGDVDEFVRGAGFIDLLKDNDKVLIAEACTHNPQDGDIARVKLPMLLRKKTGKNLDIDVVSGNNFPSKLEDYSLIIHCGACMFNKKYVLNRIESAKSSQIPITNYGIAIAYITGILDKIEK
jgi:hydrogenase maturation GTPase hydF